MQAQSRIYTTATRDRIVEEGDPDAAFLVAAGPGDDVPLEYAERYRAYLDGQAIPEQVDLVTEQAVAENVDVQPAATKARAKAEDK